MTELLPVIKTFKKYKKQGMRYGMTLKDVFELELETYNRVQCCENFPRLISYNNVNFTITLENCGISIHRLKGMNMFHTIKLENVDDQVDKICKTLEEFHIAYLDLSPQNICYKDNQIFLIDFDKVVLDNKPKSKELETLYIDYTARVSPTSFKLTLKELVINPEWPQYKFKT
jgi:tRNA A-37 threonylcarbamoyl transferase component Bud32